LASASAMDWIMAYDPVKQWDSAGSIPAGAA
jgi:hypothetical protein